MQNKKNKFYLGAFDEIVKTNEKIDKEEIQEVNKTLVNKVIKKIGESATQDIHLSSLNFNVEGKNLKVQKYLSLKKSTILRFDKLAKKFGTFIFGIIDKSIRTILKLEN